MSVQLDLPVLLTPKETAAALRVSENTLAQWRFHKRVPLEYIRVGRAIRYRLEDVRAYVSSAVTR